MFWGVVGSCGLPGVRLSGWVCVVSRVMTGRDPWAAGRLGLAFRRRVGFFAGLSACVGALRALS